MRPIYLATLLCAVLDAAAAERATEADLLRILPPPGLYRIESLDATTSVASAGQSTRRQEADDIATRTIRTPEGRVLSQKSNLPQPTICVPPRRAGMPVVPPRQSPATCRNLSNSINGDTLVLVAQCQTGRLTQTIRRLREEQWEFGVDTEFAGVRPDAGALRPMLEMMARNGATAADRDNARRQLAALPQLKAESDQQMADVTEAARREARQGRTAADRASAQQIVQRMDNPAGVRPLVQEVGTERWTRIGEQCAAGGR
nr:hypothetical protein [uncultured Duganella sp.]